MSATSTTHNTRQVSTPSRRALLTGTAALAAWFAGMNVGAGVIASIAGYHDKVGMLFALSMSAGYGLAAATES